MLKWSRLEIDRSFLLLMALLYYFDDQGMFFWMLACCALHEAAHWAALRAMGAEVRRLRLTVVGAEMILAARRPLSYEKELAAAMAGPGANLALAFVSARLAEGSRGFLFAGLNMTLGLFNLLPVEPLDGGRALRLLLSATWSCEGAERVLGVTSALAVLGLFAGGMVLLWQGQVNPTLFLTALWLTADAMGRGAAPLGALGARPRRAGAARARK